MGNKPGKMIRLAIAGIAVELSGLDRALAARGRRRYARFLTERAPELSLSLHATRDGEHRPDGMPLVERTGPDTFRIGYGSLSAELDVGSGRGQAELPPSIWVIDSLLRMAVGLMLVARGGLLLHGSGVVHNGVALVCFGPSGVGKTTIARSVPAAQVMCDEMIALIPDGDGIVAYGTPFHGDYRVCAPLSAPLGALVRLVQGGVDELEPLSPAAAVQALLASTLFFCRDDGLAESLLSAAIGVCTEGAYRLTFQRGTHVPTFIGARLGPEFAARPAAGAVAQAPRPRLEG